MPEPISRQWLAAHHAQTISESAPIRVMQFGEGNFLRAFVDWIFKKLNDSDLFSGRVRVVQPIAKGMVAKLAAQEYVYSLLLRGLENGTVMDEPCFVDVIADGLNPYAEWRRFLGAASDPDLRYVVSNTTEAGIVYAKTPEPADVCPETFPAKVAAMLMARHRAVNGDPTRGLVFLPCELIENNGGALRDAVRRHLDDWHADEVGQWVDAACLFYNTLVDRIVTGYPAAEAEAIWERLDCRDELLVVGEYFHLWVIEGDPVLGREIPFDRSGLNVVVTADLKPYRDRKVRVLNGAHTGNVLAAFLAGLDTVGEMMEHPTFGRFLREMVMEEIVPGVKLPDTDRRAYAASVFERFRNPFVRHELIAISLNSVSKWKVRVLPSLKDYVAERKAVPKRLAFSLAALIAFYRGDWRDDAFVGRRRQGDYPIRDDREVLEKMRAWWAKHAGAPRELAQAVLADAALWDEDLTAIPGLADQVSGFLAEIIAKGAACAAEVV